MDSAIILKRKPYLYSLFEDSSRQPAYHFETARSGERYIAGKRPLASRYAPGEEASRLLASYRPRRIIVISGAGNPIVIERLLKLRSPEQICMVIDHRHELLQFLLKEDAAFQEFAATPNCHIFSPAMLDSLWSYLAGLPVDGFRGVSILRHPGSLADNTSFYREIEIRIHEILKSGLSDLLTRFEFESLWLRNTLLNLRFLPQHAGTESCSPPYPSPSGQSTPASPALLAHWKGCWKGPALLVGAGPSLRQSLPLIKRLSPHCLIVACDTALKPLLRSGIRPQIVHVLDAQPHSLLHLRGEDFTDTVIVADLVVHPHLPEKLRAPFIFSTTTKYYFDAAGHPVRLRTPGAILAQKQCGEIGSLQSGGSVATSAFDMLRFFEASVILLVGTDMAWTHRQLHCVSTHHYEKWSGLQHRLQSLEHINQTLIQRRITHPVEALNGGQVPGDHVLDLYRHWFEESIASLPDLPVWNLTADGAFIKGAYRPASLNPEYVLEELRNRNLIQAPSAKQVFAGVPPVTERRSDILEAFACDLVAFFSNEPSGQNLTEFFERYPDALALRKKADSYIKRNADRLTEERRQAVMQKYVGREVRRLQRWLHGRSGA
jgi:hypothetical protein